MSNLNMFKEQLDAANPITTENIDAMIAARISAKIAFDEAQIRGWQDKKMVFFMLERQPGEVEMLKVIEDQIPGIIEQHEYVGMSGIIPRFKLKIKE